MIKPDTVIMLGESGQSFCPTLERIAVNMDDFPIPDNVGNQPQGELIIDDGPVGYFSSLPLNLILSQLQQECIPATISNSAGLYLCNRLFYSIMHHISIHNLSVLAGFIHMPYLHEQVSSKMYKHPSMSRETIKKALCTVIDVISERLTKQTKI